MQVSHEEEVLNGGERQHRQAGLRLDGPCETQRGWTQWGPEGAAPRPSASIYHRGSQGSRQQRREGSEQRPGLHGRDWTQRLDESAEGASEDERSEQKGDVKHGRKGSA